MPKVKNSAGILLYQLIESKNFEVFLVHPGGPFWKNKDLGAWSIAKGEFSVGEDPFENAKREFFEETGYNVDGNFIALKSVKQKSGKIVHAWALNMYVDDQKITSNLFEMEWPPRSGKMCQFPEVDRAGWFALDAAKQKIIEGQIPFLIELQNLLAQK